MPSEIQKRLVELRSLIGRFVACQAFIVIGIWCVAAFWVFGVIDYLPARIGAAESPRAVRVVMMAIFVGVSLVLFYQLFMRRWMVRWSDSSLALLIEKCHPEFESALVTTVQAARPSGKLVAAEDEHPQRAGLLAIARERAISLVHDVDINRMVQFRPLQLQLCALGALLAFTCVLTLGQPAWTLHWVKRFFALSNEPWPRRAELGVVGVEMDIPTFTGNSIRQRYTVPFVNSTASVPKGVACQLKAFAKLDAKLVPELCTVYYQDATGNRGRANMRRLVSEQQRQFFVLDGPPLESVNDSLWLNVTGGDARLSNLRLESIDAPLVTETVLDVSYPEYLQRSTKTVWGNETLPFRTGMRLPEGTKVQLKSKTNKPIKRVDYVMIRAGSQPGDAAVREESIEVSGVDSFQIPVGVLDGNALVEVRLWDTSGVCSTRVQQIVLAVIHDAPPQVDFVLKGIGTAVTENAILPFVGKLRDDYDINQVWLESVLDESPVMKTPLSLGPDNETRSSIDLKVEKDEGRLTPKVGSSISLSIAASDFLDLQNEPHIGRANSIQLNVVTQDQLLVMLDRRELAMRKRLEQIIGELGQMRDLMQLMVKASRQVNENPDETKSSAESSGNRADDSDADRVSETSEELTPEKKRRLQQMRSQQAAAQLTKSEGELRGVEREIDQINQELINNRIDSKDRRERLDDKVRKPLVKLLEQSWPPFANGVVSLEKGLSSVDAQGLTIEKQLSESISRNNEIIALLTAILADMIDIQDYNEVIDMVRGFIDEEGQLIEKTKKVQKNQLLDLLKK